MALSENYSVVDSSKVHAIKPLSYIFTLHLIFTIVESWRKKKIYITYLKLCKFLISMEWKVKLKVGFPKLFQRQRI